MNRNTDTVSTIAGSCASAHRDGEGTAVADLQWPRGVAVDGDRNVIVADKFNHRIRKITPQGHVSTLAGTGEKGFRDGEGTVARFNWPCGLAVDGSGNVIVADTNNDCIRKITPHRAKCPPWRVLAGRAIEMERDLCSV
jgi:DNA-binding beta-propeller fold protein YncE